MGLDHNEISADEWEAQFRAEKLETRQDEVRLRLQNVRNGMRALYDERDLSSDTAARRKLSDQIDALREKKIAIIRIHHSELLDELRRRGFPVKHVAELVRTVSPLPINDDLLPLLVNHLQRDYEEEVKAGIAVVIGELGARPYWEDLKREWVKPLRRDSTYSDMLANVFVKTAKKQDIPEIIDLIESSPNPSRLILLATLRKFRRTSPEAQAAIERYAKDPEFAEEIASWPKPKPKKPDVKKPEPTRTRH